MAGLIPQSFIDDLLARVDIVDVVDKRVTLKKTGKNYSACCPFHNEKTPSFSVQPEKQFYYCFGCGAGGNALGFIMNYDNVEFPQAVETLAADAGVEVPREESRSAAKRSSQNAKLFAMLEKSSHFYQQQLRTHPQRQEAVDYLRSRGLSGEIAKRFGLGYAPPGWDNLLSALGDDAEAERSLFSSGMTIERETDGKTGGDSGKKERSKYYDRFRQRITFPIRDSRGRTIAFGGRVLGDDKPKYLNSPETPVFHKGTELYGLYENRKVSSKLSHFLIVEGYMDVIALAQMGINNAVATLGTATSASHLERLFRIVPKVVFCFDGDAAGRTAAWRALQASLPLMEDGRQITFLFLAEGEDPDTLVRRVGKEEFELLIEQAKALEDFFFDKLSQDLDVSSIEGKARLSNLANPLIKLLPKGIYGRLMLDRLSKILGVSSHEITDIFGEGTPPEQDVPPGDYGDQPYSQADAAMPEGDYYPPNYGQDYGQIHGQSKGRDSASFQGSNWSNRAPARKPGGNAASTGKLSVYHKPASLKAIQLLVQHPPVALAIEKDLSPLESAEDNGRKLLLKLIDMVRKQPGIDTATLIGYCYGSSLGAQLTQLLGAESITPKEGVEREFLQIVDNILSDIEKKLNLLRIRSKLQSTVINPKPPEE